jgi:hypothetical protein
MTMEALRTFLGWCTVINVTALILASFFLGPMRGLVMAVHGRFMPLSREDLLRAYFDYLSHYKIAVIVFNLVPYLALVLMA